MKQFNTIITMLFLSIPTAAMAAGPYDGPPESKVGPGVEEIWTDQGVRYYRGLKGTPNTTRPKEAGIMPYQPEVEYGSPQPLGAPAMKKPAKRTVRSTPVKRKATSTKTTAATRKKVRKTRRVTRTAARTTPKQTAPVTRARDAEPQAPYGMDPFSGTGILGTTRLQ